MTDLNGVFSNVNGVNLSLTGSKSYVIDEAHFTEQDCNITADGTLNVCCPVMFKADVEIGASVSDFRNVFPIPNNVISVNPNLTQNEGY